MSNYKHLTLEERERLFCLKEQGESLRKIGKILGRSDTTLGRELKRNKTGLGKRSNEYLIFEYVPCKAQVKSDKRTLKQRYKAPLKNPKVFLYVREHLRQGWTPEEISGRLLKDHPGESISTETIYRYIYSTHFKTRGLKLWEYLVNHRPKRMKKGGRKVKTVSKIPNATSIDQRPETVNKRQEIGHWETDNVIGKQTDKTALSVTVERLTRLTILSKTLRSAESKTTALIARLSQFPDQARITLTADNGAENTNHQEISTSLGLSIFFCHAYHSWEKGSVENMNQRIRRDIPKGISIDTLTEAEIQSLEVKLNSTPRKCLGYLTPYEKMIQVLT